MTNSELTPSQVADILRYTLDQNIQLAKAGLQPVALCIEGLPGISKTSVVNQVAKELGTHHFVRYNVGEIEASDLTGFPIVEYELCKDGECFWVSDKLLKDWLIQGYKSTGNQRTSFATPAELQGKHDKPIVLVYDDFNRGTPMMMNACMRVVDEQAYVSWKLPLGSTVILTCNPDDTTDNFMVTSLDTAQSSRFIKIKMKASVEDWARDYAEKVGIPDPFINFLLKHPEIIEGTDQTKDGQVVVKGNLRMWTKFFHLIGGYAKDLTANWMNVFRLGQNCLPEEHLILLHKFIEDKLDKIMTIEDMLNKDIEDVTKSLRVVIGEGSRKRNDLSAIISKRLLNYALVNSSKYNKKMIENYCDLLESSLLKPDLVLISLSKVGSGLLKLNGQALIIARPALQKKLIGE